MWTEAVCDLLTDREKKFTDVSIGQIFLGSSVGIDVVGYVIRNAIEEELEVLYDAYYEELEQYANYQQRYVSSGGTIPPPPGPGPFPGSVELDKNGAVIGHHKPSHPPPRPKNAAMTNGRKPAKTESEFDDDEGDEEEYEEEEYEEEEDEDEDEDEEDDGVPEEEEDVKTQRGRKFPPTTPAARSRRPPVNGTAKPNGRDGLFNLGTGLTVTGKYFSRCRHNCLLWLFLRSW
jgi:hypothetical protein